MLTTFLRRHWMICAVVLVTAAVYAPSVGNGFVNLDDPILVTENRHVLEPSLANIGYVFTHFDPELYIPLTFVSYQLEAWTLGMNAWHFHAVNIFLHLCSVLLVYCIALRLMRRGDIAIAVAALFALHPAHTETVLWVSSRKDLLAAVFSLGAWLAYIRYMDRRTWRMALVVSLLLLLGLLSKVTAVVMPVVFLLTHWYLGRSVDRKTGRLLITVGALAFIAGGVALIGKLHVVIAERVGVLLLMSVRSVGFSLRQILLPTHLSVTHILHDPIRWTHPAFFVPLFLILMISLIAWQLRRRLRSVPFGWLVFLLLLAPTFPLYSHNTDFLVIGSDRYLYLPSVAFFLTVVSSVIVVADRFRTGVPHRRNILVGALLIVTGFFGWMTLTRIPVFADSIAFNRAILKEEPGSSAATYNLAQAELEEGNGAEAERLFGHAMTLKPNFAEAAIQLGILRTLNGQADDGIALFKEAIRMRPDYFKGYFNLGVAYQRQKRWEEAVTQYRAGIERFPDYPVAHENLARVLIELGRREEAMEELRILKGLMK